MNLTLRPAVAADAQECGRICHDAFASIASRHGFPPDFPSVEVAVNAVSGLIANPKFYSVVAEQSGRIVGSNFLDERSTIVGVGPITVDPEVQDRQVGRALMNAILKRSQERRVAGVRLLQVAYHNRSLSLYAKLGFDIREGFAAIYGDPLKLEIPGCAVRNATVADIGECDAICLRVHGFARDGELSDAIARGTARVVERNRRITGYTTAIAFGGHSVAETNDDLEALIGSTDVFNTPGFLVPLRNTDVLRWCLAHDLRVFYMMNLMTIGLYQEPRGAYLPSVLF
jgi:predicted N-acetyltransferase YhbS